MELRTFAEIGLAIDTIDRDVWRIAQDRGMLLLTANRNMDEVDSLEQTIREENSSDALPVITIGDTQSFNEKEYRAACAERLVEIVLDLKPLRGAGRVFIP